MAVAKNKRTPKKKTTRQRIVRRKVDFEDESYMLAIVTKGRNLPPKEKLKIAELVCKMYSRNKYTLTAALKHCGISTRNVWYRWIKEVEQIEPLYKEAQKENDVLYRQTLKERSRTAAERLIDGYTVTTKDEEFEVARDPEGNILYEEDGETPKMILVRTKIKETYIKPAVGMVRTSLYNVDTNTFEQNPKPIEKENRETNIPIISWVKNKDKKDD